jgi:hypothetical protein
MIPPVQNFGPDVEMRDKNVFVFKTRIKTRIRIKTKTRIRIKAKIRIKTRIRFMIPPVQNFGPEVEMRDRNVFVFALNTKLFRMHSRVM